MSYVYVLYNYWFYNIDYKNVVQFRNLFTLSTMFCTSRCNVFGTRRKLAHGTILVGKIFLKR